MKKIIILAVVLVILSFAVLPVKAMIGGELDTVHTNVGAITMLWTQISEEPVVGRLCTATLIHPQALVTAAHCYQPFLNQGTGYDEIWVSFDEEPLLQGATYLDIEAFIPHPDFHLNSVSQQDDIALIILREPVPEEMGISPEPLPPYVGYLDEVLGMSKGKGKRALSMTVVGYGATGMWPLPDLHLDAVRRFGTITYQNLTPLQILVSNSNPGDVVLCYGDSGGPIFYVDEGGNEVLAGLHSKSSGGWFSCDNDLVLAIKYRLDTASAMDFIAANLPSE